MSVYIQVESPEDRWEVEALYDLCFAPGRKALSSYRLREGVDAIGDLSLVARDGDSILAGAIRYWPVRISGHTAILLGPVAVHPTRQGTGLGGFLIRDSLERAKSAGWLRALLVGDAAYYGRYGFVKLADIQMPEPTNPDRVLGIELQNGAWCNVKGPVIRADS